MKIRNGFVSNSSSSSFVIKTQKTKDEVYADVYAVCQEYIRHREFLEDREKYDLRNKYTFDKIKEYVNVTKTNEDGIDNFVKNWYKEDYDLKDEDFEGTTVIYSDDNYLPADDIDEFLWARDIYNDEYKVIGSCGHMG